MICRPIYCYRCGRSLALADNVEPLWTYLFVAACGVLPILTLGGFVPILVGFSGASGCLTIGRWGAMPAPLRFVLCVGITLGCWLLVGATLLAMVNFARWNCFSRKLTSPTGRGISWSHARV